MDRHHERYLVSPGQLCLNSSIRASKFTLREESIVVLSYPPKPNGNQKAILKFLPKMAHAIFPVNLFNERENHNNIRYFFTFCLGCEKHYMLLFRDNRTLVSMLHFISRSIFSDNFHANATDFVIKAKTSVIDQLSFSFEPEVMKIALHSHLHM